MFKKKSFSKKKRISRFIIFLSAHIYSSEIKNKSKENTTRLFYKKIVYKSDIYIFV